MKVYIVSASHCDAGAELLAVFKEKSDATKYMENLKKKYSFDFVTLKRYSVRKGKY